MSDSTTSPVRRAALTVFRPILLVACFVLFGVAILGWCTCMPGRSYRGELPALTKPQESTQARLEAHVDLLARELVPRNHQSPEKYAKSRAYIKQELEAMGAYAVSEQEVKTASKKSYNVIAERKGATRPEEIIVIGAHYDSHFDTPGADDNASGVAAGIEIARAFAARDPGARTVRFIFYANEEPPYFKGESMGSWFDARALDARGARVVMMFSLEMLGYYDTAPNTQIYPPVLRSFYPDTADFVAFVARVRERPQVRCAVRTFRHAIDFPSEGFAGPSFIEGLDYSDHWGYWKQGYPAMMITDTSFFRNHHYHELTDTPDTLDFPRFARVVTGLVDVLWAWVDATGCARR